jgi:type II secretory pathway pseudopilin PulG
MRMNSLSRQHGFTMVAVMVTMLVTGLLGVAAFASVNGDLPFSRDSKDRKLAYGAAEAGLNYYLFQLNRDFDYFLQCNTGPPPNASEPNPVNLKWNGLPTDPDPRNFRKVQGGKAEYAIEMMPANGNAQCLVNNGPTVIDQSSSTFSLRTTGRSGKVKRSVGATLRRKSFLDYLYFTDFETRDPKVYSDPNDQTDAAANCVQPRAGREAQSNFNCVNIVFADDDTINGPLHTNDDILTCGTPSFGRNVNDRIEVVGPAPGTAPSGGGCPSGPPVMNGTFAAGAQTLLMPLTSQPLAARALPGYLFTGKTTIVLNGANMDVTNPSVAGNLGVLNTPKTMPLPTNGVIYVKQNSCSYSVAPIAADYLEPNTCANVYVRGTYNSSLTIASQNDVIINGDIISNSDAIMGIIADNFVRLYHPVIRISGNCNNAQAARDYRIDAALVSLLHSFIVDNHLCGTHLGNLNINGAIAQKFRGPVGQNGGSNPGYTKVYGYDDRFRYRSPPYFVEPVAAAWRVLRTNEQVPAR